MDARPLCDDVLNLLAIGRVLDELIKKRWRTQKMPVKVVPIQKILNLEFMIEF